MISCLNNLVGVRNLEGYTNPEWTFINDLAGITTQKIEDISDDEDHYEVRLAWDDIYLRASRLLESDIRKKLKKFFKNYTYQSNTITSYYRDEAVTIPSNDFYTGWYFDTGYEYKNLVINFNDFTIFLNTAGNFDLKIFNLVTGEEIYTETFEGIEGTNTFRLRQSFPLWKYSKIFVAYNENQVSTIEGNYFESQGVGSNRQAKIATSASKVSSNLSTQTVETGLILNYNLECSIDQLVCNRIDLFKEAFLYKLGIEFCNELLFSSRINRWTLLDTDEAEKLKVNFLDEYNDQLTGIMDGLKIDDGGVCFECNKAVSYKYGTP